MTNKYKYYLKLNGEWIGEFDSLEIAKNCFNDLVEKFKEYKVIENNENEIIMLDIIPFVEGTRDAAPLHGNLGHCRFKYSTWEQLKIEFYEEYPEYITKTSN
ncbi:hypothetical protein [Lysinibacillus xylanilyticus]|uniref:hypothetical protein n=1 Tax=Lysinibacillus xylanilyticus TaxID=582475 RepID=UPI0037F4659D